MSLTRSLLLPLVGFASLSLLSPLTCHGQAPAQPAASTNSDETDSNPQFWQAAFGNGGHYLVKMNTIVSASKHEYISDGVARVVEVTIGNSSAVVARFYFFEALAKDTPIAAGQTIINRVEDINKQVASRIAPAAGKLQVVKNYPASTHSHTVEYAVQTEATLNSLYNSLMSAIHTGRGRTWREPASKQ